jgi:GT2 family glycosyltransferase
MRSQPASECELTVGMPTFGRERVLLDTLDSVLRGLDPARMEVVVADQTPVHEEATSAALHGWAEGGRTRLLTLDQPSLTGARNAILRAARGEVVLFLDDDMILPPGVFEAHLEGFRDPDLAAVTGQVYNCLDHRSPPPLEDPGRGTRRHVELDQACEANNISGGNHSVRREAALRVGGYDEHFVGAALAEDLDFCQRLMLAGYRIRFEPRAWVIHLGYPSGGCGINQSRAWPEWTHSASAFLYGFRHGFRQRNLGLYLWMAFRHGPGRKEIAARPWRWPAAWAGFARGLVYGYRRRYRLRGVAEAG